MKRTFLALLAGSSLLIAGYFGTRNAGGILSPVPSVPFVFIYLIASSPLRAWLDVQTAVAALPVFFFFTWNPSLLRGQIGTPMRTYVLVAAGTAVGIAYLADGWSLGVKYQGIEYTRLVSAENALWIAILCVLFFRNWRGKPSFMSNLMLHWVFFAWLAWYAFPYLDERG
jgi:hypothetical protein